MSPYGNLTRTTLSLLKYPLRLLRIRMLLKMLLMTTTMVKTAQKRCSLYCMIIHHVLLANGYDDLITLRLPTLFVLPLTHDGIACLDCL